MKLITLNIWGGHVHDPLLNFIQCQQEIDIFCLQEVYRRAPAKISTDDKKLSLDIFSEIAVLLPEHSGYFRPIVREIYGISMFVKKGIEIVGEGVTTIHENPHYSGSGPTHSRALQWLKCRINDRTYAVMNVHGLWNGQGKTDSPERIEQSKRIKDTLWSFDCPKVLCGDFNLRPDTESMKILEIGMHNLIRTHNITSTRTSLYLKDEKFADYVLTSPEITVNAFEVMNDEVSDHSPLYLDFI